MKKKSFLIYTESLSVLDELNKEQIADLFLAIKDYQNGVEPKLNGLMKAVFLPFKNYFDENAEKYEKVCEKRRNAGSLGGKANASKSKQMLENDSKSKQMRYDSDSDSDSDSEYDSESDSEIEEKELPFEISTKKESTSSVPDTSRGVTERKNHIEDNFNELWSIYKPYKTNGGRVVNKGGRSDALRAYKNALKRGTHEEIKRGIYGYLKSCKENDTLSAMFSTFLNKDYWDEFKTFRCPEIDAKPVEKAPKVENTFEATFEYMEKENLKKEAEQAEWEQIKADLLKYAQRKNGDNK